MVKILKAQGDCHIDQMKKILSQFIKDYEAQIKLQRVRWLMEYPHIISNLWHLLLIILNIIQNVSILIIELKLLKILEIIRRKGLAFQRQYNQNNQLCKQKYLSQSNANILKASGNSSVFQDSDNNLKQSSGLINIATGLPKRSGSQKVRDSSNQHFNKRKDWVAFIETQQQDVTNVLKNRNEQSQNNNSIERETPKDSTAPVIQKEQDKNWDIAEIGSDNVTFNIKLNDDILSERDKMIKAIKSYIKKNKRLPPTTLDYYKFVKLVGKGAFGKVTLGVHKLTGWEVAIKTIEKSYMKDDFSRKKVLQEVYILKNIKHSNVIRLLEVFESPKHLLIVMEYSGGGDLLKYIKKHGRLTESKAREYFIQIVYGLAHCHWRSVLHRDVKLDNILLDSNGGVKLCDFGVSKIMKKDQVINEQCGTPAYIAPEIISDQGYSGFNVDIWSLGVLLYAMLWGTVPFKASNMKDLHNLIMKGSFSFPWELSSDVKDLIKNMLKLKPEDRYSIPEILNSDWIKSREMTHDSLGEIDINTNVSLSRKELNIMNDSGSMSGIVNVNVDNLFNKDNYDTKLNYKDYIAISQDFATMHLDEDALGIVESFGYPKSFVKDWIKNGDINHATVCYHLLNK